MERNRPHFIINDLRPERAQALENLQSAIYENTELMHQALMRHVSVLGPLAVDEVIRDSDNKPAPVFEQEVMVAAEKKWQQAYDPDQPDIFPFVNFDDSTEAKIDQDITFKDVREQWKKSVNANQYTQRVRVSRMIMMMADVNSLEEATI
ncbi:MAG TPA: hypothetical protein VLF39_00825 [Candidatus Saccharimonadales bacterium]|nr:hypothetical protein [Candidatus Saccharimonadales bacterium]